MDPAGQGCRWCLLPALSAARKPGCGVASSSGAAFPGRWSHLPAVRAACTWSGTEGLVTPTSLVGESHLHCEELAVQQVVCSPSVVFQESSAGAPKGRQCMKPGWSPCCCCDGVCWLALPCVARLWSCSPALGLCALWLALTEVSEANAFSQVHPLGIA